MPRVRVESSIFNKAAMISIAIIDPMAPNDVNSRKMFCARTTLAAEVAATNMVAVVLGDA